MEVIRNGEEMPFKKTAVALGNFDGLHKAHMAIIENCRITAEKNGLKCGVFLFSEHTSEIIKNEKVGIITGERAKLELLEKAGMDFAYIRTFDKAFMNLSPEEFITALVNKLHPKAVFVGYDYRFGFGAKGDTALLKELGSKYGFSVNVTEKITYDGVAVKSTTVRKCVSDGDMEQAYNLLGRPFSIEGEVIRGLQNGRKIGIPTANIGCCDNVLIPKNGVYAGRTYVDGECFDSVINVGTNPTFDGRNLSIESHLLGFDGDIYGKTAKVEFVKYLRGDIKFNSIDGLVSQIRRDIENAVQELKNK